MFRIMTALEPSPAAWEPLTPRGVAAFAHARLGRLLLVQFIVAAVVAISANWFLSDDCFPTIRTAIEKLPDQGEIRNGQLDWHGDSPQLLAEGSFLALNVDLDHSGGMRSPAQVQVEFGKNTIRVFSLFGYVDFPYPPGQAYYFDRTDLEPIWGAWEPDLLALTIGFVIAGLMLAWAVLATLYFLPVWLMCFYADRAANFRQSWRLAGAALMPGALLFTAAIVFYALGALDLIQMAIAFVAHLLLGWVYLFVGPLFLPRVAQKEKQNPFLEKPRTAGDSRPGAA
jgi:hypothetical protein